MTAAAATRCYRDDFEQLCAELDRLDLRLRRRSWIPASAIFMADDKAVSLPTIGTHSSAAPGQNGEVLDDIDAALAAISAEIDARTSASNRGGVELSLPRLAEMFSLTPIECQALVVCLAPELRQKYQRLYAALQDDVSRRTATIGLALDLLCDSEADRWEATRMFGDASPLVRWQLLTRLPDPAGCAAGGLDQPLRIDPRITQFLLGDSTCDSRLHTIARFVAAEIVPPMLNADVEAAANLLHDWAFGGPSRESSGAPVVYLRARAGVDATDMAQYLCGAAGMPMLAADTAALLAADTDQTTTLVRVLCREAVLTDCAVFLDGADALLRDAARPAFNALRSAVADAGRPLILAGEAFWRASSAFDDSVFVALTVERPDISTRRTLWRRALAGHDPDGSWSQTLASRFVLTPRQIRNAAALACQMPRCGDDVGNCGLDLDDLAAACRVESDQDLGELAVKVDVRRGWGDLVLPADKTAQLRELCDQVRHRHVVYGDWGYGVRLGHGTGVTALFSGPPGTGKTVAAQVVAGDVCLPLYKIDLSGVVSKYIGETEKNLAKIFDAARAGNAVLFFDEADALFGKRTEVSDAHDRYANIETSYLLQRLEEHDGVVILASNLRANLDDAFTRRIRSVVEFPFPDESLRRQIWESHFPAQAPLSADVDLDYLAREYPVAGGNISNIAVGAAFLAAADGGTITTRHVLAATKREYDKLGKLWR